jgi:multidrug resistance efflux pump
LAQRLPVRIALDKPPPAITLAIGRTATVAIVGGQASHGLLGVLGRPQRDSTNNAQ